MWVWGADPTSCESNLKGNSFTTQGPHPPDPAPFIDFEVPACRSQPAAATPQPSAPPDTPGEKGRLTEAPPATLHREIITTADCSGVGVGGLLCARHQPKLCTHAYSIISPNNPYIHFTNEETDWERG